LSLPEYCNQVQGRDHAGLIAGQSGGDAQEIPHLEKETAAGNFKPLRNWLKEKILD